MKPMTRICPTTDSEDLKFVPTKKKYNKPQLKSCGFFLWEA